MKCDKCGNIIGENENACKSCGNKIENNIKNSDLNIDNQTIQLNSVQPNKNKSNKLVMIILIIVILSILGLLVYFVISNEEEKNNDNKDNMTTTTTTTTRQQVVSNAKVSSEMQKDHTGDEYANYYYLLERLNSSCGEYQEGSINLFINGFNNLNDTTMISIALDALDSSSLSYFDLSKIKTEYPNALDGGYGIKYDVVLEKVKSIFGNNIKISNKNYFRIQSWKYIGDLDAYIPNGILNPNAGSGCMPTSYNLVISSVIENENNLIINVYGARNKQGSSGYLRKDGSTIDISYDEITDYMRQHLEEFNLFELTFVKENGNYIITALVNK